MHRFLILKIAALIIVAVHIVTDLPDVTFCPCLSVLANSPLVS